MFRFSLRVSITLLVVAYTLSAGGAVVDNLAGYWKLDEGSGASVADSSSNGNGGTVNGTASWLAPGQIGPAAINFNTASYVSVADPGTSSLDIGGTGASDAITISAWVNLPNYNQWNVVACKQPTTGPIYWPGNYEFRIQPGSGRLELGFETTSGTPAYAFSNSTGSVGTTNAWHQVAMTFQEGASANNVNFYIDGKLDSSATNPYTFGATNNNTFFLGYRADGLSRFAGSMDDVGLWSRALTAQEIALVNGLGLFSDVALDDPAIDNVLAVYNAQAGKANAGAQIWHYVAGLSGPVGSIGGSVADGTAYIVLGPGDGVTMAPEPSTLAMLLGLGGLCLLGWLRRRRG